MKTRNIQKKGQVELQAPGLDEIITISKEGGKPKLELKRVAAAEKPEESNAQFKTEIESDVVERVPKKRPIAKKAKTETRIKTRKPKAEPDKEKPKAETRATPKEDNMNVGDITEAARVDYKPVSASQGKAALAEAALFLSPKPLMLDELARIMGVSSLGYVKESLESLKSQYEGRGIEVVSSPDGWQMQVKSEYLNAVAHLAPYADISEGPKRALALILFKEPLKQSDLTKMQGNKVYDYLRILEKTGMIKREPSGRTRTLTLTKEFERYFGEEKEKIKERLGQELAMQPAQQLSAQQPNKPKINVKAELKKMDIEMEEG